METRPRPQGSAVGPALQSHPHILLPQERPVGITPTRRSPLPTPAWACSPPPQALRAPRGERQHSSKPALETHSPAGEGQTQRDCYRTRQLAPEGRESPV